jgi:hypothetical protein
MEKTTMQAPPVCPLEAPEVWERWLESLDAADWVLFVSDFIANCDPLAMNHDELVVMNGLIDRRAAVLANLAAYPIAGLAH